MSNNLHSLHNLPDKVLEPTLYFAEIERRYFKLVDTSYGLAILSFSEEQMNKLLKEKKEAELKAERFSTCWDTICSELTLVKKLLSVYRNQHELRLYNVSNADNRVVNKAEEEYSNDLNKLRGVTNEKIKDKG